MTTEKETYVTTNTCIVLLSAILKIYMYSVNKEKRWRMYEVAELEKDHKTNQKDKKYCIFALIYIYINTHALDHTLKTMFKYDNFLCFGPFIHLSTTFLFLFPPFPLSRGGLCVFSFHFLGGWKWQPTLSECETALRERSPTRCRFCACAETWKDS